MIWSLTNTKQWQYLEEKFSWVADMRDVPQDATHHAEGDVAIHTQLVLNALLQAEDFQKLPEQQKEILWAAALLHDVEKRSTTRVEDGQITSAGHARKGELTTRHILYKDIPTPFIIREQIASLVRFHGLPLWVMEKQDPVKSLCEASLRTDMKLLSMLARVDVLGRVCRDQHDMLDRIGLFNEFCIEQQCWHSPRKFSSGLGRFIYFQKDNAPIDYNPYDDLRGEVVMMSGLPGMGKDTYLQKKYPHLPVISLDDIRRKYNLKPDDMSATGWAVQEAKEQARVFLRKGESFAWNATNVTRQMRGQWIDLFVSYKARVRIVYVEVPYTDWQRQNSNREHPVPIHVLSKMLNKLEIPCLQEAHAVEYIVK
jgi:predicted kinase